MWMCNENINRENLYIFFFHSCLGGYTLNFYTSFNYLELIHYNVSLRNIPKDIPKTTSGHHLQTLENSSRPHIHAFYFIQTIYRYMNFVFFFRWKDISNLLV